MGDFILIPALSGSFSFFKKETEHFSRPLQWWVKGAVVYYPYLLISYGACKYALPEIPADKVRSFLNAEEAVVFTDSGGLQMETLGVRLSPKESFEWQCKVGDYIFVLDLPPVAIGRGRYTFEHLKKCAEVTRNNIEAVKEDYKKCDKKIYGILHGRNEEMLEYWFEMCVQPYLDDIFYGVAFGVRPEHNFELMALIVSFLKKKGVKRIHALGIGSMNAMALLIEASDYFELVTSDTTTFTMKAARGKAIPPLLTRKSEIFAGKRLLRQAGYKNVYDFCMCPVCTYARENNLDALSLRKVYGYTFLSLHNLWVLLQYMKVLKFFKKMGHSVVDLVELEPRVLKAIQTIKEDRRGVSKWF